MTVAKKKNSLDSATENVLPSKDHSKKLSVVKDGNTSPLPLDEKDFDLVDDIETHGLKINLPSDLTPGENITRIKMVTSSGKEIILTPDEAKQFIDRASDEIDKIVIEQVREEGADRYSLHLGNGKKANLQDLSPALLSDHASKKIDGGKIIEQKNVQERTASSLEQELNKSFLNQSIQKAAATATDNVSSTDVTISNTSSEKDYVYRQRIFIRKRQKKGSEYFYRAENHIDLFNIGQSYMNDYNKGKKSFAFAGEQAKEAKEKTIFGLCSFFNYHTDATVTIVTKKMDQTFYHMYVADLKPVRKRVDAENISFSIYECEEFQVIEFDELIRLSHLLRSIHVEDFIQEIVAESDLVFWDLPDFDTMSKDRNVYFPTLRSIDNVTFMIKEGSTEFNFLHHAKDFFKKYDISIKGALVNKESKK